MSTSPPPRYDQDDYEVVCEEIPKEEALLAMIAYMTADIERIEVGVTSRVTMSERDDEIVANYYAAIERKRAELAALQLEYNQLMRMQSEETLSDCSFFFDSPRRPLSSDHHPRSREPERSTSRSHTLSPLQAPLSQLSGMQPPLSVLPPTPQHAPLLSPRPCALAAPQRQSPRALACNSESLLRHSPRASNDSRPHSSERKSARSRTPSPRQPPFSHPTPSRQSAAISSPRQPVQAATPQQSPNTLAINSGNVPWNSLLASNDHQHCMPERMSARSHTPSLEQPPIFHPSPSLKQPPNSSRRQPTGLAVQHISESSPVAVNTFLREKTAFGVVTSSDAVFGEQPRGRRPHNPRPSPADAPSMDLMSPHLNAMVGPLRSGRSQPGTPRVPDLPPPPRTVSARSSAKKVEDASKKVLLIEGDARACEKAHGSRQRSRQSAIVPSNSRSTVTMSELSVDLTQVRAENRGRNALGEPESTPRLRIEDCDETVAKVHVSQQSRSARIEDRAASSLSTTARTTGFSSTMTPRTSDCLSLSQRSPQTPRKQAAPPVDRSAPLKSILASHSAVTQRTFTNRASTAESRSSVSAHASFHSKPTRRRKQHAHPRLPLEHMSIDTPVAPLPSPQVGIMEAISVDRRSTLGSSHAIDTQVSPRHQADSRQSVFVVEESTKRVMGASSQPSRRRTRTQRLDDSPRKMPHHEWENNFPPVSFPPDYELTSFCASNFWRVPPPPRRKRSWCDKLYLWRRRTMRKIRHSLYDWV